jgi:hypothetical protein
MTTGSIGHNSEGITIRVEARFFNSLAKYSGHDGLCQSLELPVGACVGHLINEFRIPLREIFLVLRNGRDITPGIYQGGVVNVETNLEDGDVIAFSGPVPYSYGYGAPVV